MKQYTLVYSLGTSGIPLKLEADSKKVLEHIANRMGFVYYHIIENKR